MLQLRKATRQRACLIRVTAVQTAIVRSAFVPLSDALATSVASAFVMPIVAKALHAAPIVHIVSRVKAAKVAVVRLSSLT